MLFVMNRRELTEYHGELTGILKSEPDRSKWTEFLSHERTTDNYKFAKEQARLRNLIKPILPEVVWDLPNEERTEYLVNVMLNIVSENLEVQRKVINYSEDAFAKYKKMPDQTVGQKKDTKKFLRDTAEELFKNVRYINVIDKTWRRLEARIVDTQESQETFSERVKDDALQLIGERWEKVAPEQIAQLVRIYTDENDPHQAFAKEMLVNYFRGPPDRPFPRIVALYNFVFAMLDLVGEDEAFREGVKIALYATDILPRDPGQIEQINLLAFPSKTEEKGDGFKKLLIIDSVTKQAISISGQDFTQYLLDSLKFTMSNTKFLMEWMNRIKSSHKERGPIETKKNYNQVVDARNLFSFFLTEPFPDERKQELMKNNPILKIAFNPEDPLNQKFNKVFSNLGV